MPHVYQPAEDSQLLLRHASLRFKGTILDMGTGSGYLAVEAAQYPSVSSVVAVDINPEAVETTKQRAQSRNVDVDVRLGGLFEPINDEVFDLIMFNAPYLPSEGEPDEPSWSGGSIGKEILVRFLDEARNYLKPDGEILVVYSDKTGISNEDLNKNYVFDLLEEYPLFYESLYCVLLRSRYPF